MWHHAGADKTLRDRQSRHYYDVAKLYGTKVGNAALADLELLRNVSAHKRVFFARAWAKFDEAVPGSLRLVPPESRITELERDYSQMRSEMIYGDAPSIDDIVEILREIENRVNS